MVKTIMKKLTYVYPSIARRILLYRMDKQHKSRRQLLITSEGGDALNAVYQLLYDAIFHVNNVRNGTNTSNTGCKLSLF